MSPRKSTPSKSKRNESRRSSILKPRKPRQPFQNVNFDSPTKPLNEISSTPLKTKRRVSFAEKKHVKEFCHSVEQGTVWDNTYEEHDFSLKALGDSNGKTESTEDASLHISKNECGHICEGNLNYSNNFNLTNNQLSESIVSIQEKDNENCEMTFTNSIKCIEFDERSQCEQTTLLNKSALFQASKNATLRGILVCSNTDENHIELVDERSQFEQNVIPSALSTSCVSENAISSIIIYRDSDEENNIRTKSYSESPFNNVASELDRTCDQDLSMEFTAPVPTFLLPSHAARQINVQKEDNTNYIGNCNNVSIQAASVKPDNSDLGIFKQIAEIQNRGNANLDVENNTHDKTIFSTNLQSNDTPGNTVFKQTEDATQNITESMILTNVIHIQKDDNTSYISNCNNASIQAASMKPLNSDLGIFKQIAEIQNRGNANLDIENNTHDKTIFSTNLQPNDTPGNTVFKQTEDATQNIAESMILTNVINVQKDDNLSYISNCNNASIQATSIKPVNSDLGIFKQIAEIQNCGNANLDIENNTHDKTIFSTNLQSNDTPGNTVFKQTEDATQNITESMILTNVIHIQRDDNTSYISNCNNASIQAASMKPLNSDLEIFKQIAEIQNRGNANLDIENNTHDKTIFSTNLQSNDTPGNTVFKQTEDATQNITESMILTNVINVQKDDNTSYISNCNNASIQATSIKPVNSDLGIFKQIAEIQNRENANLDVENNTHDKTIFSTNLQSNVASENTVFKQTEDATQNIAESMILTTVIQPSTANINMFRTNNTVFNTSMEMTAAISSEMYDKIISHSHDEDIIEENDLRKDQTDETEYFTDVMVEMTKPVNVLPLIVYDKEKDLRMDEVISNDDDDDKTMFFQDVSMDMTNVLLIKNQEEITHPIVHKSISEESTCTEKNMDNSSSFNEKTRLLCKSMEFTEAVPVSLHYERTFNTTCTVQSTSISQTMSKVGLPVENSVSESILQADTVENKTIQHEPMEISATDSSTLHLRGATNGKENSIISKDNEFQPLTSNNLTINDLTANDSTESRKSVTKENYTISRNNLDHSLNVLKNISSRKETFENEEPNPKKFCSSSCMESHISQENNVHLSLRPNDNYVNDTECNEYSVKDHTMDHSELSRSNFRDNLDISERNLLRKSLENNIIELNSIKPPSFLSFDSDKEENSFLDALHEDKLSTDDGTVNNSSNQLIANNVTECLAESRIIINDTRINESTNAEDPDEESVLSIQNEEDDCLAVRRTIINDTRINESRNVEDPNEESMLSTQNEEDDCQTIRRTIINDTRINESNRPTTNVEDPNEESVSSTQSVKHGETNTDYFTSPVIEENEVIDERNIRERINDDAEPRNNIKEKETVQRLEIERCTDHLERTEVIEKQSNSEKYCKKNLNDEARALEQRKECAEERFAAEQCVSMIEDESLAEQDPFLSLLQKLETHSERDDCIWNVYYKNIDKKKIVFGFISNSLILIATFISSNLNLSRENLIEKIRIVSRASDNSGVLVRIVHKLILEKLDEEMLMYLYKTHEDVLPMLERISQDVKLAMDFMFDLKRLDDLNLMEIAYNEILFLCRSKRMNIILKVTIKVKRFDKLTSNDINVNCLLGTIKETDVKSLIKNIKKDHKFLRRYMNDIKDYIDIMEEALIAKRSPIDLQ